MIISGARMIGAFTETRHHADSVASCLFYVSTQFPGKIDPHEFDFGGRRSNPHATFGRPNGDNAIPPTAILYKHSKEQVLPDRECIPPFSMPICLKPVAIIRRMKRSNTSSGVARLMGPTQLQQPVFKVITPPCNHFIANTPQFPHPPNSPKPRVIDGDITTSDRVQLGPHRI